MIHLDRRHTSQFACLVCGRCILVGCTLDFGCVDVGFRFGGRWILISWTLNFGLLGGCWILVVWTLDFGFVDVEFWLFGR